MRVDACQTPALLLDAAALDRNLARMSEALPGPRLRPHVKAHKCTTLARRQAALGHEGFCCATVREMEGMAEAGLGKDLLLANEVIDPDRLALLAGLDARVTVAIDSPETLEAASKAGIEEVVIDVNVGLPRCGCPPEAAGGLAGAARRRGLGVRGVMGYEGHVVGLPDATKRQEGCAASMALLAAAHRDVGGELVSAGGTGTYACNDLATEIQAGSYALMDTAYGELDLGFEQAFWVLGSVISVSPGYTVLDCGLKALGMDHGAPSIPAAQVWFCSDEHITYAPEQPRRVGDRVRVHPAHVDPTIAYHEAFQVIEGAADGEPLDVGGAPIVDRWSIDLRGW